MKEAHYGCDDKNPCCDGLSCRIEEGFPPGNLAPLTWKCTKDDYGNKHTSLIEVIRYIYIERKYVFFV